ncbi:hypothetical protein HZH66_009909 [Vespula vulgaris]|uniref:Uncharacterized protein n=1 Tax=Vespula vulgaris TaxID=7454 RepID=A0A834MXI0_VESVU|nr:hypothetical protein HZH66_009909 [Vespula vulgaris]
MKLWSGDTGLPEMTTKSSVRPIMVPYKWFSLAAYSDDYTSQFLFKLRSGDSGLRERKTKTGLRLPLTDTSSNEIVEWEYSPTRDDNISDSYWYNLASNFDEYASQVSQHVFSTSNREELIFKLQSGDTRLREGTTKTVLRSPLTVISLVVFWTSTRELGKFRGDHTCKLNCEVGIVVCERGQQRRACDRLLQILVQLCFGLRQGNLENFAQGISASIDEQLNCEVGIVDCERGQQRRAFDRLLQLLVQLCFGLRRGNLENFAEGIPASINKQLNCEVGIVVCERGQRRRACDRLLQLLVQLCFGLRGGNLENFAEDIPASINEQFQLRSGDTRLREKKTKTGLRPTLTVTGSLVFWTSTRELGKFRGGHSCKLKCEVGILSFERRQQSCAFDRLLQSLVQLCFGLRQGNIENFAGCLSSEYSRRRPEEGSPQKFIPKTINCKK